jgi:hypothetical protein
MGLAGAVRGGAKGVRRKCDETLRETWRTPLEIPWFPAGLQP